MFGVPLPATALAATLLRAHAVHCGDGVSGGMCRGFMLVALGKRGPSLLKAITPCRCRAPGACHYLLPDVGLWVVDVDLLGVVPNEVDEAVQRGAARGREVLGDEWGRDHAPRICKGQPSVGWQGAAPGIRGRLKGDRVAPTLPTQGSARAQGFAIEHHWGCPWGLVGAHLAQGCSTAG